MNIFEICYSQSLDIRYIKFGLSSGQNLYQFFFQLSLVKSIPDNYITYAIYIRMYVHIEFIFLSYTIKLKRIYVCFSIVLEVFSDIWRRSE